MMSKIFNTKNISLLGGTFGLERETLRVNAAGGMAQTPHPFPDDLHIVKDFCENQAEINTGVHDSAQGAIEELLQHSKRLSDEINNRGERLWLYSNPPISAAKGMKLKKAKNGLRRITTLKNWTKRAMASRITKNSISCR